MTNFVFSRRALQEAINRLATVLDADQLRLMVDRLNRAGETRLPTMWEIVLLDAFAGVGRLRHEVELPNGRRETNMARRKGHYFFSDIRKEGVVLYELDDEPSPSRGRAVFRKPTRRRRSSPRLYQAWPREEARHRAWFNRLVEAYVKARYSKHYMTDEEALTWLGARTERLHELIETACKEHLAKLKRAAARRKGR